jgi:hypothetical protein
VSSHRGDLMNVGRRLWPSSSASRVRGFAFTVLSVKPRSPPTCFLQPGNDQGLDIRSPGESRLLLLVESRMVLLDPSMLIRLSCGSSIWSRHILR